MLRIDADWYESVKCCLENLYDSVSAGGILILDDYFMEGCSLAVHEFFGSRKLRDPLETTSDLQPHRIAFLRKGGPTWQYTWEALVDRRTRLEVAGQIASVVPEGGSIILVDDNQWEGSRLLPNRRVLPFL